MSKKKSVAHRHRLALTSGLVTGLIGASFLGAAFGNKAAQNSSAPIKSAVQLSSLDAKSAFIGSLKIDNTLQLAPSSRPASPKPGQVYFDKITKTFVYYNGYGFQTVATNEQISQLESEIAALKAAQTATSTTTTGSPTTTTTTTSPTSTTNSTAVSSAYIHNGTAAQTADFNITGNGTVGGALVAGSLSGDGSGLTSVNASQLNGQAASFYSDAGNLSAGTLSNSRLSANVTLQGNSFNGNSQLIQLDSNGAAGSAGLCLMSTLSGTAFQSCPSGAGGGDISSGASQTPGRLVKFDTTNNQIVNSIASESGSTISVAGTLAATSVTGNGSGLTSVNATQLNGQAASYYTNASNLASGTVADARLSTDVTLQGNAFNGASQLIQLTSGGLLPVLNASNLTNLTGANVVGNISGNAGTASALAANPTDCGANTYATTIAASGNLTCSAINDTALSANVTLQGNTFNGVSELVQLTSSGLLPALNGSNLSNVNAAQLNGQAASFYTNAGNLTSGTLADARLSANVSLLGQGIDSSEIVDGSITNADVSGTAAIADSKLATITTAGKVADSALSTNVTLQGNVFNGSSQLVQLTAGGILPVLNGSNLTAVNASQLNGQVAAYYTNATNLSTGTLADARLTTNVTLQGNAFNGNSQLVQLTSSGLLPVLNGSNLTNVNASQLNSQSASFYTNASNLSSGTLADGRLSANVPLLNATNVFSGSNTVSGALTVGSSITASTLTACGQVYTTSSGVLTCGTGLVNAVNSLVVAGHSIAYGVGASDFNHRYTSQLAGMLHASENNFAVGGAVASYDENGSHAGGWVKVMQNVAPTRTAAPYLPMPGIGIVNYGLNDIAYTGPSFTTPYINAMRTIIARFRAAAVFEDTSSTFTFSQGTGGSGWGQAVSASSTSGGTGEGAGSNGNTYTIAVPSDFPGGTIDIGLVANPSSGAVHTYTVDGNAAGSIDTRGIAPTGRNTGVVMRLTGLTAGAHTIVGTISNFTSQTYVDYWEIEAPQPRPVLVVSGARAVSYSTVYGGAPYMPTDSDVNSMNTSLQSLVAEFDSSVKYVDVDSALNKTAAYMSADGIHPNDAGHTIMAQALYKALATSSITTDQLAYASAPASTQNITALNYKANLDTTGLFQVQNAAGTSILSVDTSNARVGISTTPLYGLDVHAGNTASQIHFAATNDTGGYLTTVSANTALLSGGASFNGANWVAKATTAGIIGINGPVITIYGSGSLTAGNTFTPTTIATFANSALGIGAAPTASNGYLQLPAGTTLATGGIAWGTDTALYRTGAGVIKTDGTLNVVTAYQANGTGGITATCSSGQTLNNIAVKGGIVTSGTCTANAADIAESYNSTDSLVPGDIVATDPANYPNVLRSTSAGQDNLIGVVSTHPAQTLDDGGAPYGYPVALAGRVPVKVNDEGGAIHAGDKITSSSVAGQGKKATGAGMVIGTALEDASNGSVMVFIHTFYYDPTSGSSMQGGQAGDFSSLNVSGATTLNDLTVTGVATVNNLVVNGDITLGPDRLQANVAISAGVNSWTVTFTDKRADNRYAVQVTPGWDTSVWVTDKTADGFVIHFHAPLADATLDWSLLRQSN